MAKNTKTTNTPTNAPLFQPNQHFGTTENFMFVTDVAGRPWKIDTRSGEFHKMEFAPAYKP